MDIQNKLEVHYYFDDESHNIDAFVKHKCDGEILLIAKDLLASLGYDVDILSEIPSEGGYKELFSFLKKNKDALGISISALALIVGVISLVLTQIPSSNSELEKLQRENLELDNEEKRLKIEQLKKDLQDEDVKTDTSATVKNMIEFFDSNYKIIKHKSNFYQALQSYPKVSKISTTTYLGNKEQEVKTVERKDFHKFILSTNKLPELTIEDAVIEIVSPVLVNENYKWKGVYDGETIDFYMKDEKYKNAVIKKEITFHNGYYISALLKVGRYIDDFGVVQLKGYSVLTVIGKVEDGKIIETEQGKRYKKIKQELSKQTKLEL